jgi:cell division septal protein FtsQ
MFFQNKNKKKLTGRSALKGDGQAHLRIVGRRRQGQTGRRSVFSLIFYWLAFLAFAGAAVFALFFSPLAAVSQIEVRGVESYDPTLIQTEIEEQICGKYLNALPKNNIILFSKDTARENILQKFKMAEAVEIKKVFPDKLAVRVQERKLGLVFCGGEQCLVLDDRGRAIAPADFEKNELKENELLRFFEDGGKTFQIGEMVMDAEYVQYVLAVREKIQDRAGIQISKEIRTPQIASGDIRMQTEEGWKVYLDWEITAEKEAEALHLVLENKISKDERKNLEYVDLRAENKVYYKYRNTQNKTE